MKFKEMSLAEKFWYIEDVINEYEEVDDETREALEWIYRKYQELLRKSVLGDKDEI